MPSQTIRTIKSQIWPKVGPQGPRVSLPLADSARVKASASQVRERREAATGEDDGGACGRVDDRPAARFLGRHRLDMGYTIQVVSSPEEVGKTSHEAVTVAAAARWLQMEFAGDSVFR